MAQNNNNAGTESDIMVKIGKGLEQLINSKFIHAIAAPLDKLAGNKQPSAQPAAQSNTNAANGLPLPPAQGPNPPAAPATPTTPVNQEVSLQDYWEKAGTEISKIGTGVGHNFARNAGFGGLVTAGVAAAGGAWLVSEAFERARTKKPEQKHDGLIRFGAFMAGTATAVCGAMIGVNMAHGLKVKTEKGIGNFKSGVHEAVNPSTNLTPAQAAAAGANVAANNHKAQSSARRK